MRHELLNTSSGSPGSRKHNRSRTFWRISRYAEKYKGWVQIHIPLVRAYKSKKAKKRDRQMHSCTHLSRFALVSRVFSDRYAKKYTGYCITACVPKCIGTPIIIQFGVLYLQAEVGAKWVQIKAMQTDCVTYSAEYIRSDVVPWTEPGKICLSFSAAYLSSDPKSPSILSAAISRCDPSGGSAGLRSCRPGSPACR